MWSVPDSNRYLPKGRNRSGISTSGMLLITPTNHGKVAWKENLYTPEEVRTTRGTSRQKGEATRERKASRQKKRARKGGRLAPSVGITLDSLWNHRRLPSYDPTIGIGRASKPKPGMHVLSKNVSSPQGKALIVSFRTVLV